MVEAMDRQIGRVMQALDSNGLTENTIVIFTSDNGGAERGIDSISSDLSESACELDEDDPAFKCREVKTPGLLLRQ
jgi:arylsulfatase A-like enzyme